MSDKRPILSICIPTYNRAETLKKNVISILNYPSQDLEVVVSDNCSTDETIKILNEINDDRLSVHSNSKNIGSWLNGFKCAQYSRGGFFVMVFG